MKMHDPVLQELSKQLRREFPDANTPARRDRPFGIVPPLKFSADPAVSGYGHRKWGYRTLILKDAVGKIVLQKDVKEADWAGEAVEMIVRGNRLLESIKAKAQRT